MIIVIMESLGIKIVNRWHINPVIKKEKTRRFN